MHTKTWEFQTFPFYNPDDNAAGFVDLRIWSQEIQVGDQEARTNLMQVPLLWHR